MNTKFCKGCDTEKDINEFWKDKTTKDGLRRRCKDCDKKKNKKSYGKNRKKRLINQKEYYKYHKDERLEYSKKRRNLKIKIKTENKNYKEEDGKIFKRCSSKACKQPWKDVSEFHKDKYKKDGLRNWCKDCTKEHKKIYREENKEKIKNYDSKEEVKIRKRKRRKERMGNDCEFYITMTIHSSFRKAMKDYSKTGKIKNTDKYGINYKNIIEHLGLCPGNREDYHIDHIFPIIAFNHNDPIEIIACWHSDNLRWLTKEENLKKGDNYNKEEFEKYLKRFKK
jgi:hypothetical protein